MRQLLAWGRLKAAYRYSTFARTTPVPSLTSLKRCWRVDIADAPITLTESRFTQVYSGSKHFAMFKDSELWQRPGGKDEVATGREHIQVTLGEDDDWDEHHLEASVAAVIDEFLARGTEPLTAAALRLAAQEQDAHSSTDSEVVREIKALLEKHAKPFVQADGGDIEFVSFSDGVVRLRMVGACASCPSSTVTAKFMIRNMLNHYLPVVEEVEALDQEDFNPNDTEWTG